MPQHEVAFLLRPCIDLFIVYKTNDHDRGLSPTIDTPIALPCKRQNYTERNHCSCTARGHCQSRAAKARIKAAPAFTEKEFSTLPSTRWVTDGGNLYNQRYSPLTHIYRDTIKNLKGEWRTHLSGSGLGTSIQGRRSRCFHEGVLYIFTGASDVFAIDVESGRIRWTY